MKVQLLAAMNLNTIFVTVGTTEFSELIAHIDQQEFVDAIFKQNCKSLMIQIGRGSYPDQLQRLCKERGISCTIYRFKPTLTEDMSAADLIISHCGAGSIIEAMNMKKPLIVVVNSTLQGNHQTELSDALATGGYCMSTTPESLAKDVTRIVQRESSGFMFKPFPEADLDAFPALVDEIFGFSQY